MANFHLTIRFYNILSCLPPNIAQILAFFIELLSIVQAQLGWQKRVWNCEHFFHVYNKKKTFYWTDVKQLKKEDVLKSFTFDWKYHEKRKQKWTKKIIEKIPCNEKVYRNLLQFRHACFNVDRQNQRWQK